MTDPVAELAQLELLVNDTVVIAPCVSVSLFFHRVEDAILRDCADRALEAVDPLLTHVSTGRAMKKRGKASAETFAQICERRQPKSRRFMLFRSAAKGASPAALTLSLIGADPLPQTPDERKSVLAKHHELYVKLNGVITPPQSEITVTFPLDHPLADPAALLDWVMSLKAVQTGAFTGGEVGYGLNSFYETGDTVASKAMHSAMKAALLRHSGLTFSTSNSAALLTLLRYWPGHVRFIPQLKRVNWLTMIPELTLSEILDGRDAVIASLSDNENVSTHNAGGGLVIQAGAAPRIGDVARGDALPDYRDVARAVSKAQMPQLYSACAPFKRSDGTEWLKALERVDA